MSDDDKAIGRIEGKLEGIEGTLNDIKSGKMGLCQIHTQALERIERKLDFKNGYTRNDNTTGNVSVKSKWATFAAGGVPAANMIACIAMIVVVIMSIVMAVGMVKMSGTATAATATATQARDYYAKLAHFDARNTRQEVKSLESNIVDKIETKQ
jgi:hypothetical protein